MKITVLGTGTSHGVPVVGCSCPVCTSDAPADKRMRTSIYVEGSGGEKALIDAGPEFRLQALKTGITGIDAIFLTHSHADHLHGLDDLRPLSRSGPIPVYGNEATIDELKERFSYIWKTIPGRSQNGGGKPRLTPLVVGGPVRTGGLVFTPIPVKHGILDILGWELRERGLHADAGKSFLYLTDTSAIPPSTIERLSFGVTGNASYRVVVIGGLRIQPHETHFSFKEAINAALGLGAKEIYLTHICHDHSHAEIEEFCREYKKSRNLEGIEIHPAMDGLELNL